MTFVVCSFSDCCDVFLFECQFRWHKPVHCIILEVLHIISPPPPFSLSMDIPALIRGKERLCRRNLIYRGESFIVMSLHWNVAGWWITSGIPTGKASLSQRGGVFFSLRIASWYKHEICPVSHNASHPPPKATAKPKELIYPNLWSTVRRKWITFTFLISAQFNNKNKHWFKRTMCTKSVKPCVVSGCV